MSDIFVTNVTHKYKNQLDPALSDISISIRNQHINGLLGPNGAGKTTLIHIICGLIQPTFGSIEYGELKGIEFSHIKNKIGFVPQQDGLFADLTLHENLMYYGGLYSLSGAALKEKIIYYSKYLQLDNQLHKLLKHFSGGMNRRANIIAALLHEPDFVIFDEPTAGVDIQSRALIHEVINDLKNNGKTILYTSHLLSEAEMLCDHIVIMDHGKIMLDGSPESLLKAHNSNSLEQLFLSLTGNKVRD